MSRKRALFNNDKVRFTLADYALRVGKTIHVNRDPAAVHEHEVAVTDHSEMARPVSLDEELFWVPSQTEHFGMTGSELFLVYRRCLIRVHVCLAGTRTCTRLSFIYMSATFNVGLSMDLRPRLRFCLWIVLILRGTHLLTFCRCSSLRVLRLPLRLLWLLLLWLFRCLAYSHKR